MSVVEVVGVKEASGGTRRHNEGSAKEDVAVADEFE